MYALMSIQLVKIARTATTLVHFVSVEARRLDDAYYGQMLEYIFGLDDESASDRKLQARPMPGAKPDAVVIVPPRPLLPAYHQQPEVVVEPVSINTIHAVEESRIVGNAAHRDNNDEGHTSPQLKHNAKLQSAHVESHLVQQENVLHPNPAHYSRGPVSSKDRFFFLHHLRPDLPALDQVQLEATLATLPATSSTTETTAGATGQLRSHSSRLHQLLRTLVTYGEGGEGNEDMPKFMKKLKKKGRGHLVLPPPSKKLQKLVEDKSISKVRKRRSVGGRKNGKDEEDGMIKESVMVYETKSCHTSDKKNQVLGRGPGFIQVNTTNPIWKSTRQARSVLLRPNMKPLTDYISRKTYSEELINSFQTGSSADFNRRHNSIKKELREPIEFDVASRNVAIMAASLRKRSAPAPMPESNFAEGSFNGPDAELERFKAETMNSGAGTGQYEVSQSKRTAESIAESSVVAGTVGGSALSYTPDGTALDSPSPQHSDLYAPRAKRSAPGERRVLDHIQIAPQFPDLMTLDPEDVLESDESPLLPVRVTSKDDENDEEDLFTVTERGAIVLEDTDRRPTWSPWGLWGECSVTCGPGQKARYRHCVQGPRCEPGQRQSDFKPCFRKSCSAPIPSGIMDSYF